MKSTKGFTLIELMIVITIIGIIAAVGFPQYKQYVIRGNRSAAESFMMDIASRENQYLLDARTYTSSWSKTDTAPTLGMTAPIEVSNNYSITISVDASVPSFQITAAPVSGGRQDGDGNLTLDNTGAKTHGSATHW